jgi:site-specific DNA-methyltransferase (adenine-specific)
MKLSTFEYFYKDKFKLYLGDSFELLNAFEESSIDMIFADPPYFLSDGGFTCSSGKFASVDKAEWDTSMEIDKVFEFNYEWLRLCKRILKEDGTIWVTGTHHNIFSVGYAMKKLKYKIINNITWFKPNAPPNLSCRYFTHSTESALWARKNEDSKHTFNYKKMRELNGGKQMRDVWDYPKSGVPDYWRIPLTPKREKQCGKFPTQKPLQLLERIILSSTNEGDTVLDPFNGSGTTGVAAAMHGRNYVGIDKEKEYLDLTKCRLKELP